MDANLDLQREARTGDPEVIFGLGKTPAQVVAILADLHAAHPDRAVLATRLTPEAMAEVERVHPGAVLDRVAGTASLGPVPDVIGEVLVVTAGTSDLPVAREALVTAEVHGARADLVVDVGVAGLHRILAVQERLRAADVVIVVAGMEGALASVVGGLVGRPVIAVPTSVGYGAAFEGVAALLGMLNSCSPGVTVVNIDNGYGAAVAAARIVRAIHDPASTAPTDNEGGQ